MSDERIVQLLTELLEGQKEHLELYRDAARQSLEGQRVAIDLQRRGARLYRIVVSVAAVVVAGLVVFVYSLPI